MNFKKEAFGIQSSQLLETALTHRSWVHETDADNTNERMEFLGDAVLSLVISFHLYKLFPKAQEGDLARMRSSIVSMEALARTGRRLDLGEAILLGRGEEVTGGREKDSIIADTLEALVGAMYLEGGLEKARDFILKEHREIIEEVCCKEEHRDAKTLLQEKVQKKQKSLPQYRISEERGPDHKKVFVIDVYLGGKFLGRGEGPTKKMAQQKAAAAALEKIEWY